MNEKYSVVDLFAGAGGFGLGFEMEDFDLSLSIEKDQWAVDTLNANKKNDKHKVIKDDIRKYIDKKEIIELVGNSPDVIIGGPPCQGYSLAGPSKDPKDPRNSLFYFFARWVSVLSPKVFVMENVTGILHRKNANGEKVLDIIKKTFESKGYHVEIWKLNSANYGVPQLRTRVFIVGNKFNKKIGPPSATHYISSDNQELKKTLEPCVTVWEAIGDLPMIDAGQGQEVVNYENEAKSAYQSWCKRGSDYVYNHVAMKHTKRLVERFKSIHNGSKVHDLPDDQKVRKRNGNGELSSTEYQSNYRHLKPNAPSFTIPASFYSNFIHTTIPRNITSREAARIQSFPDNYIFKGKRTQISSNLLKQLGKDDENHLSQYNQIGNAVPPLLAKSIAKRINTFLSKELLSIPEITIQMQSDSVS